MSFASRRLTGLSVLSALVFTFWAGQASAQNCRWAGTAPFCSGDCSGDETELARLQSLPDNWSHPYVLQIPRFGSGCATGTKALCCKMPGRACRWDGTAPFCDGECGNGETKSEPPEGSSSGASCATGSKVYCCHRTGSVLRTSAALEANPKLTRYAAIWDKGAGAPWQARHGLTSQQYQQEFDRLKGQGYRLVDVSGYSVGDQETYAAIWEKPQGRQYASAVTMDRSARARGDESIPWAARHGLTADQYQQEFDRLKEQGYRLVHVNGYAVGGRELYAAIWEKRSGPAWIARHGMTSDQYQQELDRLGGQGYHPVDVSGYTVGGLDHYAAIWEQRERSQSAAQVLEERSSRRAPTFAPAPPWVARYGLTSDQYQEEFNKFLGQGFRLVRISGWHSGDTVHYAAIWEKVDGPAWVARHGMLADSYQEEFDRLSKEGYRLRNVCGFHTFD